MTHPTSELDKHLVERDCMQQQICDLTHQLSTAQHMNDLYQAIIDQLPMVIYAKDVQGTILLLNKLYTRVSNMSPEQVIGKNQTELFPPEMCALWKEADAHLIATGTPSHTENIFSLDGDDRRFLTVQFPYCDETGTPTAICAISEDVTEHRRKEQAIAASRNLLQLVVDNMPFLVYITNLEGTYTLVNRFAASLMNLAPADIVGKNQSDLFPAEVVDIWNEHNQVILETGQMIQQEEPVELPDGMHVNLSIKFPIFDEHGTITSIGGISMDITERKRLEQEQVAAQSKLIEAQQESLRELSTPLLPIAAGILVMPLIGRIDNQRAQQIMETLLEGVAHYQAEITILDITGVPLVDTQIAAAIIRTAQAVKLLGARVVLSGISPHIAQTLVHLGVELKDIATCNTLQAGIAYAMEKSQK